MNTKIAVRTLITIFLYSICFMDQHAIGGTTYNKHDDLHRLIRIEYADLTVVEYTYDELGNRLSRTVSIEISLNASPFQGGTVTGGGSYAHGDTVTVTADANKGYSFDNWTEDDQEVSTNNEYIFTAEVSRTLTANFIESSLTGSLQVTLEPEAAASDGGRWRRADTQEWFASGHIETGIPAGDYTVEFLETSGWVVPEGQGVTVIKGQTASLTAIYEQAFDVGDGTVDTPYQVSTPDQLDRLGRNLSSHFILTADIDLAGYAWKPIGTETDPFTGGFDGGGHIISNIAINNSADYAGLFGYTDGAVIANTGIENVDILAGSYVGGLVGYARNSTILQCYATGFVSGQDNVGGIAGTLAADTGSVITDSYADCNVSGNNAVGGLVGYIGFSASIVNVYAVGSVTNDNNPGGLVGVNEDGTYGNVMDSFWDTDVGPDTSQGGTGKTTTEMKQQSTFTNWDFNETWTINEGKTCPYLQWQPEPILAFYPNMVNWNGNLVADFGDNGLWYHDGASWNWMTNRGHVGQMVVWDGKLVVDFGADHGLHYYDGSWHWMTNKGDVSLMLSWYDGHNEKLVVDFGDGRRIYTYDGSWHWFNNKDAVADMIVWDNKLVVDFGNGRNVFHHDGVSWTWMTNKDNMAIMLPWDDGTSEKLVVDFGNGRRIYTYNGSWHWLNNKDDVNAMAIWNNKLVVDFGNGRAMFNYDGSSWYWMTNKDDVRRTIPWHDGSADKLVVDFGGGRGLHYYDGSWNWMRNADDVPEMLAWGERIVVDFGSGIGIYNYDGTWNWMRNWSTVD